MFCKLTTHQIYILPYERLYDNSYFAPGRYVKYCDECLFFGLSAHITRNFKNRRTELCMLPVAMARSSSDGVTIGYVLPVLRMTSCFHSVKPVGRIKHEVIFRRVRQLEVPDYQLDVRQLQCLVEFVRMQHRKRSLLSMVFLLARQS